MPPSQKFMLLCYKLARIRIQIKSLHTRLDETDEMTSAGGIPAGPFPGARTTRAPRDAGGPPFALSARTNLYLYLYLLGPFHLVRSRQGLPVGKLEPPQEGAKLAASLRTEGQAMFTLFRYSASPAFAAPPPARGRARRGSRARRPCSRRSERTRASRFRCAPAPRIRSCRSFCSC